MKHKHDDEAFEVRFEKPFDFSRAGPNPSLERARRASGRFVEVSDAEDRARSRPRVTKGRTASLG